MATNYGAKDVGFFLVGGYNVLAGQTQIEIEREAVLSNITSIGDTWETWADTGSRKAMINQDGWYDATANQANAAICDREGTNQVICLASAGNVAGRPMLGTAGAFAGKYTRILSGPDLHKAKAVYTCNGIVEDPLIVRALAAVSGDGNTNASSLNNVTDSHAGGAGFVQVTALSLGGYTNLAVSVLHSTDNNSFVPCVAMTVVTVAPAAERKAVAGDIYQYLSASWAFTGSGTAHSATFVVGFTRL